MSIAQAVFRLQSADKLTQSQTQLKIYLTAAAAECGMCEHRVWVRFGIEEFQTLTIYCKAWRFIMPTRHVEASPTVTLFLLYIHEVNFSQRRLTFD